MERPPHNPSSNSQLPTCDGYVTCSNMRLSCFVSILCFLCYGNAQDYLHSAYHAALLHSLADPPRCLTGHPSFTSPACGIFLGSSNKNWAFWFSFWIVLIQIFESYWESFFYIFPMTSVFLQAIYFDRFLKCAHGSRQSDSTHLNLFHFPLKPSWMAFLQSAPLDSYRWPALRRRVA